MSGQKIFVAYRRDPVVANELALELHNSLERRGYEAFVDRRSVGIGEWRPIVVSAIAKCDFFLFLLTPGCLSTWAVPGDELREEFEYALRRRKKILLVYPDEADFSVLQQSHPPETDRLFSFQAFPLRWTSFHQDLQDIIEWFGGPVAQRARFMPVNLVQLVTTLLLLAVIGFGVNELRDGHAYAFFLAPLIFVMHHVFSVTPPTAPAGVLRLVGAAVLILAALCLLRAVEERDEISRLPRLTEWVLGLMGVGSALGIWIGIWAIQASKPGTER